jgi:hypothetical protein
LVSIDQLHLKSDFIYRRSWTFPKGYQQEMERKRSSGRYASVLEQREVEMYFKLKDRDDNPNIEKMRRLLFEKDYERKVDSVAAAIIGDELNQMDLLK